MKFRLRSRKATTELRYDVSLWPNSEVMGEITYSPDTRRWIASVRAPYAAHVAKGVKVYAGGPSDGQKVANAFVAWLEGQYPG